VTKKSVFFLFYIFKLNNQKASITEKDIKTGVRTRHTYDNTKGHLIKKEEEEEEEKNCAA
jgi:hypothetical protein